MHYKTLFILLVAGLSASAQKKTPATNYPTDYFRNPLDIPIFLAGNFGECRPGHFHSGIDIKTLGKENQPVHAAAEGYISRIKMEKGGFGHGLYITHPNGYTTLYAHLNDFAPAIQAYVRKQQYAKQRWDVDLQLSPDQFKVKKGEQVAWSGNTGASTAPHLHFEIRNTKTEHPLNPELFGLPIVDEVEPIMREVAIYTANIYQSSPVFVPVKKVGGTYKPVKTEKNNVDKDTITIDGADIGIAINADDYMDGSDNSLTFYTAQLYMDDKIQAMVTLDNIGYDETRYINAYADYKTHELTKRWLQCLFQLPGNNLDVIFSNLSPGRGKLTLTDNAPHKIDIVLTDDKGNQCKANFYLRASDQPAATPAISGKHFTVGKVNSFNDAGLMFTLDGRQLYDDISFVFDHFTANDIYSEKYTVHYPYVPLHHYFDLAIKPNRPIPFDLRSKVVLMYSDGKSTDGSAAKADDNGWYKASVRDFGMYWLNIDTVPPVIKTAARNGANLAKAKQILFNVKDATTSVRSFNGYIDDKWACFEQHGSAFFYKFDEHCPRGKHKLVFTALDENGNSSTYTLNFTR
jgi:hypothetical protein